VLGGTTLEEKQKLVSVSRAALNKFKNEKGEQFITDALSAHSPENYKDYAKKYNMNDAEFANEAKQIQYNERLIELAGLQEEEAYQAAFNMSKSDYTAQMDLFLL
jgi:hypothetical protein